MSARGRRAGERAPAGERRPRTNGEGSGDPKLPPRSPAPLAGRETGPEKRRPRTRAPAAPGQRNRKSISGGGGVGGGGAREANRSSGAALRALESSAQVRNERGAGPVQAAGTAAAPALALTGGLPLRTPGSLGQLAVPGGIPGGVPRPRELAPQSGPQPGRPALQPPAPAPGPRFLRHWPRCWGISGLKLQGGGPRRRRSLPPSEASAIN